jgi:hypothetical protein
VAGTRCATQRVNRAVWRVDLYGSRLLKVCKTNYRGMANGWTRWYRLNVAIPLAGIGADAVAWLNKSFACEKTGMAVRPKLAARSHQCGGM